MFYDFIEIGTSDFDTLIERADDQTVGLSIEPIFAYLDRLPCPKRCAKLNAAISDHDGEAVVFFIAPEKIAELGLPEWFKGCNSVGKPHQTVASFLERLALHHVTQRVDNFPKVSRPFSSPLRRPWQQAFKRYRFLIGQIARTSLRLLLNANHPAARRRVPHPQLESRPTHSFKPLSNGLLDQSVIFSTTTVPAYRLRSALTLHGISGMFFLKVDTEGHDVTILSDFFEDSPRALWPHKIIFESNELSDNDALQLLIAKLITIGYDIKSCNTVAGDGDTFLRLNNRRARTGISFSNEIEGYYLVGHPDGYDPTVPGHDNTLIAAKEYCVNTNSGGVTYQDGRFEVRRGEYLEKSRGDRDLKSWISL
jgi:hypothetical protein